MNETQDLTETSGEFAQTVASDGKDRRLDQRFVYGAVQAVAFYDGTRLPTSDMFRQVQCRDLSRDGMSFIWPHAPEFERVVVKLAAPGHNLCLVARVVHSRPLDEADAGFLIGCAFLSRVRVSE